MKIIDRAALSHPVLTGISREHLGGLIEELADPWLAQQQSRLRDRRGGRDRPGIRLHTLADVFAYAAAEGAELRIDGTEVQVRRPAGR